MFFHTGQSAEPGEATGANTPKLRHPAWNRGAPPRFRDVLLLDWFNENAIAAP